MVDEIKRRTLTTVKRLLESSVESEIVDELLAAGNRRTDFRHGYRYRYLLLDGIVSRSVG